MPFRFASLGLLAGIVAVVAVACGGGNVEPPGGASSSSGPDPADGGVPDDASTVEDAAPPDSGPPPPPPDPTEKVFDLTKLHTIDIVVDAKHLDQLDNDTESRVPCAIQFDDVLIENAGCRKKGGYGSVQPLAGKTGFSIKLNEFDKGKNLHGLTRLTLNNAIQDPTFLNEHLGYEVYRRVGIPAARTAHGMVRFNGETKGLFVVAESVDKKFLARHFGEENKEGNLYEGPAFVDFVTNAPGMELKDEVEEMRKRDDINELAGIVQTAPDATLAADVSKKLDFKGFITGYAIDVIFHHWDGYSLSVINNYYMYNNPATGRFVFMPHGMDQLFQDVNFDVNTWPNGRLSQRVREIPALDQQFHDAIVSVLKDHWDVPYLLGRIDQVTAVVNSNTNMDPAAVNDLASYNAYVNGTRDAVAYRKAILLGEPLGVCGNGVTEVNEDCDDANTTTGDGCSSACFLENCVPGSFTGVNYLFCADARRITDARKVCASYGGELAVPKNAAENNWVVNTAFSLANQVFWLGIDDEKAEGVYVKPDGTAVQYFAWADGKPNGAESQNCVAIEPGLPGGAWNDKGCSESYGAVCRVP